MASSRRFKWLLGLSLFLAIILVFLASVFVIHWHNREPLKKILANADASNTTEVTVKLSDLYGDFDRTYLICPYTPREYLPDDVDHTISYDKNYSGYNYLAIVDDGKTDLHTFSRSFINLCAPSLYNPATFPDDGVSSQTAITFSKFSDPGSTDNFWMPTKISDEA